MTVKDFNVIIIGGGSCGLALAQGLRKAGIAYTLGWMISVDPWYEYDSSKGAILVLNGKTGKEIKRPVGVDHVSRVSRKKMRKILSENLNIEYSKRLQKISTDGGIVTAHFEDGTSATGSLLVGCDGGKSKARDYVVGIEAAKGFDSDFTMINTSIILPAEVALALRAQHPIIVVAQHPEGYPQVLTSLLNVPYKNAPPDMWSFQILMGKKGPPRKSDLSTNEKAMTFFKGVLEQYTEPFCSIGKAFPDDHILPVDDGWNFKPTGDFVWNNYGGKVTLAGDAAHSMLPHRAQGLNNAIKDSAGLVDAIMNVVEGKQGLKEAIDEYEAEMRPRGTEEVMLSYQQMICVETGDWQNTPMSRLGFGRDL